jgi:hypothetical protein
MLGRSRARSNIEDKCWTTWSVCSKSNSEMVRCVLISFVYMRLEKVINERF